MHTELGLHFQVVAEYEHAIKRMFRKTSRLDERPLNEWNVYTVTLHDVESNVGDDEDFKEIDIEIDERLLKKDGTLYAAKPTAHGELWPCYLEKAVAAMCGRGQQSAWHSIDGGCGQELLTALTYAISGGNCPHAWRILLGVREVYQISDQGGGFSCFGSRNPSSGERIRYTNAGGGSGSSYEVPWPDVRSS